MQSSNKSVTFVYGSDDFLVDRRARFVFDNICGGHGEILPLFASNNLIADMSEAISSIETMPLFESGNTVWLRSVCFFGESTPSEEEKRAAMALLESMGSSHEKKIIVSATGVDKRTKIFKDLIKIAESIDMDADSGSNMIESAIGEFAEDNGVTITPAASLLLQMKCGNNTRLIGQEIAKLATHVLGKGDEICERDVLALVDDYDGGSFFDPVERFFENDLNATFQSMDRYFFHNHDARPLLAAFQSRNRVLIQLRVLIDSKRIGLVHDTFSKGDFSNAAKFFHMETLGKSSFNVFSQNPWYLSKLVAACKRFPLERLLGFQPLFASAFGEIAARYHEQKTVMKELAVECLFQPSHSYFI